MVTLVAPGAGLPFELQELLDFPLPLSDVEVLALFREQALQYPLFAELGRQSALAVFVHLALDLSLNGPLVVNVLLENLVVRMLRRCLCALNNIDQLLGRLERQLELPSSLTNTWLYLSVHP